MSQGVPGTPPPKILLDAIGKAAADPRSCGYCPMTGEAKLREALALDMKNTYGRDIDVVDEDIALTAGCNMAFVTAIMAIADAGDEVIVPVPWYVAGKSSCTAYTLIREGISTISSLFKLACKKISVEMSLG